MPPLCKIRGGLSPPCPPFVKAPECPLWSLSVVCKMFVRCFRYPCCINQIFIHVVVSGCISPDCIHKYMYMHVYFNEPYEQCFLVISHIIIIVVI